MAWKLYLFVGTIAMTSSALKCKHSYPNTEADPRYQYEQGVLGVPAGPYSSPDVPQGTYQYVPEENKRSQLRIEEPAQRSGNSSKVLNWKSYPEIRRGEINDNSKIVFPGPTSEPFRLDIPENCKKLGFCENISNYPHDQVKKLIDKIGDISVFQNDKLDIPEVPDITQRLGPQEDNRELCDFEEKVVYPKAATDSNNKWHVVLNQDDNPIQGFRVEICNVDASPCSDIAIFQPGYEGRCKQKFTYRKMTVLHNGTMLEKSLKVPSCCSCVARLTNLR